MLTKTLLYYNSIVDRFNSRVAVLIVTFFHSVVIILIGFMFHSLCLIFFFLILVEMYPFIIEFCFLYIPGLHENKFTLFTISCIYFVTMLYIGHLITVSLWHVFAEISFYFFSYTILMVLFLTFTFYFILEVFFFYRILESSNINI